MPCSRVREWGALVALTGALYAAPTRAQTDAEVATRARLLAEAQRSHEAGDHARALEIAQAAGQISMTPSLRFFIGRELRDLGRYAAALGVAQTCLSEVGRDATIPQRELLLSECIGLRREAESMVGSVTVVAPAPAPEGLRVSVDGEVLRPALVGLPYVVSAGSVLIEATAPGQRPFRFETRVPAGSDVRVPVVLVAEPAPAPAPSAPIEPARRPDPPPRRPEPEPARSYVGPVSVMGAGAATVVVGGVLWALGNAPAQSIADACPQREDGVLLCADTPELRSANAQLQGFDTSAAALWVAGGAALVGGGLWLLLGRPTAPRAAVEAAATPGGATVRVRF